LYASFILRLTFLVFVKAGKVKIWIINLLFKVIAVRNSFNFKMQNLAHKYHRRMKYTFISIQKLISHLLQILDRKSKHFTICECHQCRLPFKFIFVLDPLFKVYFILEEKQTCYNVNHSELLAYKYIEVLHILVSRKHITALSIFQKVNVYNVISFKKYISTFFLNARFQKWANPWNKWVWSTFQKFNVFVCLLINEKP
jgi:hypothetical protein